MDIDDSHMTAALESLISEASPTLTSRSRVLGKRPNDIEPSPAFNKSPRSSTENSTVSHHNSTSGSITTLTDIIRNNPPGVFMFQQMNEQLNQSRRDALHSAMIKILDASS